MTIAVPGGEKAGKWLRTISSTVALAGLVNLAGAVPAMDLKITEPPTSGSITRSGEEFTIAAPNNVYGYVSTPVKTAVPFRASASIQAPESSALAPSVFLYWGPGVWLRIGYIAAHDIYHVNGPGVYGVISDGSAQTEYRLTTTSSADWMYEADFGGLKTAPLETRWNHMAILLDKEAAHFQVSQDGRQWQTLRSVPRPESMRGNPAQFIVGKGYDDKAHTAVDLRNSLADAGALTTATLRNIKLEQVQAADVQLAKDETDNRRDVIGQAELAKPGDPTFESVAAHWPPLQYGRDALGVGDHPEEFAVQPDGVIACWPLALLYPEHHEGRRGWLVLGSNKRLGYGTTVTRSLLNGWMPVLTCVYDAGPVKVKQTLSGWSEGMRPDTALKGLLELEVSNQGQTTTTRLAFFSEHEKKELVAWEDIRLEAGESKRFYIELGFPNGSDKPLVAAAIDETNYTERLNQVTAYWEKRVTGRGMQIDVPENRVMNAWRAWHSWMFTDVDLVNDKYEYHDGGGGFYELVYGFSASQAAELADQLNRPEDARRWLDAMLSMGDKDGLFIINFGLPDQGALMNAVVHHYRYTGDLPWLKSVAPTLVKMSQWIKDARGKAMAETPTTSPVYGMIKMRPYCDHPGPAFYLVSDVMLATALQNVAEVLPEAGLEKEAQWIAKEADSYAADMRRVIKNSIFEMDGQKLLPLFPETRELLRATGWMTFNYYGLLVTSLLERGGNIVPADSELAKIIVDSLEQRGGLLMGMSKFWGGIDHAYAAGYWYDRLTKGEPEKALLGLYGSMAYGMSRDTFSSVEVTFAQDGKNFPTLPHNYSNLQQIRLVRNLLLLEQGDQLVIGAGVARHWLAPGKHVAVKDAMTPWGTVTYTTKSGAGDRKLVTSLTPPGKEVPGGIKVFARTPTGNKVNTFNVTGAEVAGRGDDFVIIKNPVGPVLIESQY